MEHLNRPRPRFLTPFLALAMLFAPACSSTQLEPKQRIAVETAVDVLLEAALAELVEDIGQDLTPEQRLAVEALVGTMRAELRAELMKELAPPVKG